MKKLFALMLALALMLGMLAGCAQKAPETTDETVAPAEETTTQEQTPAQEQPATEESSGNDDLVKIGFICWGYTDAESKTYVRLLDYAGAAAGFEPVYATFTDTEDIINQAESLIQAGCKGILTTIASASLMDLCEKNEVYLAQWASEITDEQVASYVEKSDYWIGYSFTDNYETGRGMVEHLYDAGVRNLLLLGPTSGNACHDLRFEGALDKVKEYPDLNLVDTWRDAEWETKMADTIANYMAMYPEIDGVITTGASNGVGDAVVQAIAHVGLIGKLKYATMDIVDNTREYLAEGSMTAVCGETLSDVAWLSIVMANKVNGADWELPMKIVLKVGWMTSPEEFDDFSNYVQGEGVQPYSAEEYASVSIVKNPDATAQDMLDLAYASSLEEIKAKAN